MAEPGVFSSVEALALVRAGDMKSAATSLLRAIDVGLIGTSEARKREFLVELLDGIEHRFQMMDQHARWR